MYTAKLLHCDRNFSRFRKLYWNFRNWAYAENTFREFGISISYLLSVGTAFVTTIFIFVQRLPPTSGISLFCFRRDIIRNDRAQLNVYSVRVMRTFFPIYVSKLKREQEIGSRVFKTRFRSYDGLASAPLIRDLITNSLECECLFFDLCVSSISCVFIDFVLYFIRFLMKKIDEGFPLHALINPSLEYRVIHYFILFHI